MSRRASCGLVLATVLWCAGCARTPAAAPPPAPIASRPEDDLRWVLADASRAQALGASPPVLVATGAGAPGDNLGGRLESPPDSCVIVLARSSPSVEDLDVFVYADDGQVLGADEAPLRGASVLVCPPHPKHLYAFARVAAGHGLVSVAAQRVRPADADRAARAAGAKAKLEQADVADAGWPGLTEALAAHRRETGGAFRDQRRVAVPLDPRLPTRLSAVVEPKHCIDAFLLPSDEVAFVELTVLDAEGRIIGRAPGDERAPSVVVCSAGHAEVTFELRPHAGRGLAAFVLGAAEDDGTLEPSRARVLVNEAQEPRSLDERRAALRELDRAGYSGSRTVGQGTLGVGQRATVDLDVPEGCSRLDVVTGNPGRGVEAWLWSSSGALIAHADGDVGAALFACGAARGARLDVETTLRAGPFSVEMRTARDVAGAFTAHPLAAGRALGRLAAAGRLPSPKDAGAPRPVTLSATRLVTEVLELPAGRCLDAALGLDAGAQGVELRLLDAASGEQVALVRAPFVAQAEACATANRTLRAEMRVIAGAADGLLVTRLRNAVPPHAPEKNLKVR